MFNVRRRARGEAADRLEWFDTLDRLCGVGLWDAVFFEGDALHPQARWTWSAEFRRLCGFTDEASFPNVVQSWSDRLHPEDADRTFAAFSACVTDLTGKIGYDVTYRLKVADGTYRWFRATGGVVRDATGRPRRACGSLVDINAQAEAEAARKRSVEEMAQRFEVDVLSVTGDVASAAARLGVDAAAMDAAASRTVSQCETLSAASGEADENVRNVTAAAEQMTAAIRDINVQVALSSKATSTAAGQAREATETVERLTGDVRKIGDVVNLISAIAGQTNLLALNATIEAARAGDSGKGFAVVASEVKALATQTAKATQDIAGRIDAVQAATAQVAKVIGNVTVTIGELNATASVIAAAIEQQSGSTDEIARNVRQVSSNSATTAGTIGIVGHAAVETGEVASRILAAAETLRGRAETLRGQAGAFIEKVRRA